MEPYKYISINLHIALEQQDGRVQARIVEPLPTINVDTGARAFVDQQGHQHQAHEREAVIIVDD